MPHSHTRTLAHTHTHRQGLRQRHRQASQLSNCHSQQIQIENVGKTSRYKKKGNKIKLNRRVSCLKYKQNFNWLAGNWGIKKGEKGAFSVGNFNLDIIKTKRRIANYSV